MSINKGKAFEAKFKEDWEKTNPSSFLMRIYDTTNGYMGIKNLCDYVAYNKPNMFLMELKSTQRNTLPFTNITQYDKLKELVGIEGLRLGVIIWFIPHDKVIYVPVKSIIQMVADGKKSVNIKMLEEGIYPMIEIPSVKKRVYLDSDYSILTNLKNKEGW